LRFVDISRLRSLSFVDTQYQQVLGCVSTDNVYIAVIIWRRNGN
jgi:hypothetical protein